MIGRWSGWSREQDAHVRRWTDGRRCVEVRVYPPPDALPLLPAADGWRWSVAVDGIEVQAGEIPPGTPAPQLYAPFHAMQAGRSAVAGIAQNGRFVKAPDQQLPFLYAFACDALGSTKQHQEDGRTTRDAQGTSETRR